MPKKRGNIVWGAFDESFEEIIKDTVDKLEKIGIPSPTKIEASALIAYRQKNNIAFMSEKEIKEFILRFRGFSV